MGRTLKKIQDALGRMRRGGKTPVRIYLNKDDMAAALTSDDMVPRPFKTAFGLPLSVDDLGGGSRVVGEDGSVEPIGGAT